MSDGQWWQALFETGAGAFYAGRYNAGREACDTLLARPALPPEVREQTRRNAVFYAPPLAGLVPSAGTSLVRFPVPEGWTRFKPSVAAAPDGFRLIVRSANYRVDGWQRYTINDGSGRIRTSNYLVDLDDALSIQQVSLLDESAVQAGVVPFPVLGFEDARLFTHRGCWHVSATARDRNELGICQIALLRLEGNELCTLRLLSDAATGIHEKNWMPIPGDDALRFVYLCSPTIILRYDDATGAVSEERRHPAPAIARDFRGGSQLVPVEGGYLCLIHEGIDFDQAGRAYPHRFVRFDHDFAISHVSPMFFFLNRGTEFAAGLARRGDELIASFGWWDREAVLATMQLREVLATLRPVNLAVADSFAGQPTHDQGPEIIPAEPPNTLDLGPPRPPASSTLSDRAPATPAGGFTPFPPLAPPLIASVTICDNQRDLIGDALRSVVDQVDWCIVIDSGITDDTVDVARGIAGDKLVVRSFPWVDDFAAARNFALDAAAAIGATWAVTLDTDERLDLAGADLRAALATTPAGVLSVRQADGTYAKERCFRLPRLGRFEGPTHEAFVSAGTAPVPLDGVVFREIGKTEAGYRRKFERDVAILTRYTADHSAEPRWLYYLGDSLQGLGRYQDAIAAYRRCAALDGWDEEAAWSCYRAAECWLALDDPAAAVESCALGLRYHAGLAELPWLAGYACWQLGRHAQAVYWSRLAIALGRHAGQGLSVPRQGFRYPPALYEGPYDVLRFALDALGDTAGAAEATAAYKTAQLARVQELGGS